MAAATSTGAESTLPRGMGLRGAVAINMIDMVGVGPFITIPLIVAAMGGPQAMLGWILGALFALCDGLIWAEFGATFPAAGGSYRFLDEAFGPKRWGRLFSFLFVWQLSFSAPLSIASGCIGLALYASYFRPSLSVPFFARAGHLHLFAASVPIGLEVSRVTLIAIAAAVLAVWLLYRRIQLVSRVSEWLWIGVLATVGAVIVAGITHFHAARAFDFPAHAFTPDRGFFLGLGSAMLIATYDYWGYDNVTFVGGEIVNPAATIPRAVVWSIVWVAVLYIVMNISVLGVLPWREIQAGAGAAQSYVVSVLMARVWGAWAARLITAFIVWTAFASVFSLLLGYSRVPYAAAIDGNFFRFFAHLHPRHRFPHRGLLVLGGLTVLCCFFSLAEVIAMLVVIRIALQYVLQAVGLLVLRRRRPDLPRPFRMPAYPWPVWLTLAGFAYVLAARSGSWLELAGAGVISIVGLGLYFLRAWRHAEWPFAGVAEPEH